MGKNAAYTIHENYITEVKTGLCGRVDHDEEGGSYTVKMLDGKYKSDKHKQDLQKRMTDWYYFSQVKPKK